LSEPSPRVILTVGNSKIISSYKPHTTSPKWHENHYMFIEDPETEVLSCQIEDEQSLTIISKLHILIRDLLEQEQMIMDKDFQLTCFQPGYTPKIHLKLDLKVFKFI
jgi:hypothetical protein